MSVLDIEPVELAFRDVRFATAYTCNVRITNTLNGSVECQIKAGASDRYSISPSGQVRLGPRESAELTIRLKVLKFANRKKAIEGHRDVFHIKGAFFDQKFYSTFYLAPDAPEPSGKQLPPRHNNAPIANSSLPASQPNHPAPSSTASIYPLERRTYGSDPSSPTRAAPSQPLLDMGVLGPKLSKSVSFASPIQRLLATPVASNPLSQVGPSRHHSYDGSLPAPRREALMPGAVRPAIKDALSRLRSPDRAHTQQPYSSPVHSTTTWMPGSVSLGGKQAESRPPSPLIRGLLSPDRLRPLPPPSSPSLLPPPQRLVSNILEGVNDFKFKPSSPSHPPLRSPTRSLPTSPTRSPLGGSRAARIAESTAAIRLAFDSKAREKSISIPVASPSRSERSLEEQSPKPDLSWIPPSWEAPASTLAHRDPQPSIPSPQPMLPPHPPKIDLNLSTAESKRANPPPPPPPPPPPTRRTMEAKAAPEGVRDRLTGDNQALLSDLISAGRREEVLRGTVASQVHALQDKDEVISALRARLTVAQSSREKPFEPLDQHKGWSAQNLSAENSSLSSKVNEMSLKVRDTEAQSQRYREELESSRKILLELQGRHPDIHRAIEAALQGERAAQEDRNRRSLELLHAKDASIKVFELKTTTLEGEVARLMRARAEALEMAEAGEAHVIAVLERSEEVRVKAMEERREALDRMAELEAQLSDLSDFQSSNISAAKRAVEAESKLGEVLRQMEARAQEDARLRAELISLETRLFASESRSVTLSKELEEREREGAQRLVALTNQHGYELREAEKRIQEMHDATIDLSSSSSPPGAFKEDHKVFVLPPSASSDLRLRLRSLEALNQKLEAELDASKSRARSLEGQVHALGEEMESLRSSMREREIEGSKVKREGSKAKVPSGAEVELVRIRDLLEERDREVASLRTQLLIAQRTYETSTSPPPFVRNTSGKGGRPPLQPSSTTTALKQQHRDQALVKALEKDLVDKERELDQCREKIASIETRLFVALESTTASSILPESRGGRFEDEGPRDRIKMEDEIDLVRATSLRLNSRVNELVAAEQRALEQAKLLEEEMEACNMSHRRDLAALEQRHQEVLSSLQQALEQDELDPTYGDEDGSGSRLREVTVDLVYGKEEQEDRRLSASNRPPPLSLSKLSFGQRERELAAAVQASEEAVAVVQLRLMEALESRAEALQDLSLVKKESLADRARLEHEVRMAQEEGRLRIHNLEEALQKVTQANRGTHPTSGAGAGAGAVDLARLVQECDSLRRSEARLKSELDFERDLRKDADRAVSEALRAVKGKDAELSAAWVYAQILPISDSQKGSQGLPACGVHYPPFPLPSSSSSPSATKTLLLDPVLEQRIRSQAQELSRHQQAIARLVDKAEGYRLEAEDAQAEAQALSKQLASLSLPPLSSLAKGSGTGGSVKKGAKGVKTPPAASSEYDAQTIGLVQKLVACQSSEASALEAKEQFEFESCRVKLALEESQRECEVIKVKVIKLEMDLSAAQEIGSRKALAASHASSNEARAASRRAEEAEAELAIERESRAMSDRSLSALEGELEAARRDLEDQRKSFFSLSAQHEDHKRRQANVLTTARKEAERAKAEASELRARSVVLAETVETLSSGSMGEIDQRLIHLTHQLASAGTNQAVLETRANELLCEAEARGARALTLQGQLQQAGRMTEENERKLAAAQGRISMLEAEVAQSRGQGRDESNKMSKLARSLDASQQQCIHFESESSALRQALEECQSGHIERLSREREEAGETLRHLRLNLASRVFQGEGEMEGGFGLAGIRRLASLMEALIKEAGRERGEGNHLSSQIDSMDQDDEEEIEEASPGLPLPPRDTTSPARSSRSSSWMLKVMRRMKGAALECSSQMLKALADLRVSSVEKEALESKVNDLQGRLERTTADWRVAELTCQNMVRLSARKAELAARHASEASTAHVERVSALQDLLDRAGKSLAESTASLASSSSSLSSERLRSDALQRQLQAAVVEKRDALVKLSATQSELKAITAALHSYQQASTPSPSHVNAGNDSSSFPTPAATESLSLLLGESRMHCNALKMVNSQLLASLTSARTRADASQMLSAGLSEGLRSAEDKIRDLSVQLQSALRDPETIGSSPLSARPGFTSEVARMTWELAKMDKELSRSKDDVLRIRQELSRRDLEIEEMQAQTNASQLVLQQVKDESAMATLEIRERLSSAHDTDRSLLLRELVEMQRSHEGLRRAMETEAHAAEERILRVQRSIDDEVEKRIQETLNPPSSTCRQDNQPGSGAGGYVEKQAYLVVMERAAKAEKEVIRLGSQASAMQNELSRLQAQVSDLSDVKEVTTRAVAELESTLLRIERSSNPNTGPNPSHGALAHPSHTKGGSRVHPVGGSGPRRVPLDPSGGEGEALGGVGIASLSRELVRARLSEAEGARKLRAAAREEVQLRHTLLLRDQRVEELKEALRVKARAYQEVKRKLEGASLTTHPVSLSSQVTQARCKGDKGTASAAPATRRGLGVGSRSRARSESPSPLPSNLSLSLSSPSNDARARGAIHDDSYDDDDEYPADDTRSYKDSGDAWRRKRGNHQPIGIGGEKEIVALRIEAANRSAEINRLKKDLASTLSLRPPSEGALERTRAKLASCSADCASAIATANSLVRKIGAELSSLPTTFSKAKVADSAADPPSLPDFMEELSQRVSDLIRSFRVLQKQAPTSPSHSSPSSLHYQIKGPTNILGSSLPSGLTPYPPSSSSRLLSSLQLESSNPNRDQETNMDQARKEISDLKRSLEKSREVTDRLERETERLRAMPNLSLNSSRLLEMIKGGIGSLCSLASGLESRQAHYPVPPPPELKEAARKMAYESNALEAAFGLLEQEMKLKLPPGLTREASDASELSFGERSGGVKRDQEHPRAESSQILIPSFAPYEKPTTHQQPVDLSPLPASHQVTTSAHPSDASATTSAAAAVATASAALLAEKLHDLKRKSESEIETQRSRADKWKQRCEELGSQVALMGGSCVAKEAAERERSEENERRLSEELGRYQAEILRLQASLSGAVAARKEMERAQAVATSSSDIKGLEVRQGAARLAEAQARAETLSRQIETERSHYEQKCESLRIEAQALKSSLTQEQGERVRLLSQMRGMIPAASGTAPGKNKASSGEGGGGALTEQRMIEIQEEAARERAGRERAEAQAMTWKSEARLMGDKAKAMEQSRNELVAKIQVKLDRADRSLGSLGDSYQARLQDLTHRIDSSFHSLSTLQPISSSALPRPEDRLSLMEEELSRVNQEMEKEVERRKGLEERERRSWLERVAGCQAALVKASAEMEEAKKEWEKERARSQVTLKECESRILSLESALGESEWLTADLRARSEEERGKQAQRHLSYVQEMKERMEGEREAFKQEAIARVEAESSAREAAVESRATCRMNELEERLMLRVTACELEKQSVIDRLQSLTSSHRQYQERKAREISSLEQRIVSLITQGGDSKGMQGEGGPGEGPGDGDGGSRGLRRKGNVLPPAFYSRVSQGCRAPRGREVNNRPMGDALRRGRGSVANPRPLRGGVCSSSPTRPQDDDSYLPPDPHDQGASPAAKRMERRSRSRPSRGAEEEEEEEEEEGSAFLRRELLFEKLHRQRAEAQLSSARSSIQRLKSRLSLITRSLEEVQESSLTKEEGVRLQLGMSQVKEQLRLSRAEGARRGRALQLMQSIASQAPSGNKAPSFSSSPPGSPSRFNAGGGGGLSTMTTALGVPISDLMDAGGDFEAVAAAAYQAERQSRALCEKERSSRVALETKVKEMRAVVERKSAMISSLQSRVTELEDEAGSHEAKAEAIEALEAKIKSLQSTITRKDLAFKEMKDRLVVAEGQLIALVKPSEDEPQEKAKRDVARLRAEVHHKDSSIKALSLQLEQERVRLRDEVDASDASLMKAKKKGEATRRRLVQGLRSLISSISTSMEQALKADALSAAGGGGSEDRGGGGGGFFVDEIATLTGGSLSVSEIRDLLFSNLANEGRESRLMILEAKLEPLLTLLETSEGDEARALDTIESEVTSIVQEAMMKIMTHK